MQVRNFCLEWRFSCGNAARVCFEIPLPTTTLGQWRANFFLGTGCGLNEILQRCLGALVVVRARVGLGLD